MGGFICTLIGVICKACVDFLTKSFGGGNAEFTSTLFTGIAIVLTVIGVLVTLKRAEDQKGKLTALGIHAAIWIVGYFLLGILIPLVIGAVVLCVVLTFLGLNPLGTLLNLFSGTASQDDDEDLFQVQKPEEKTVEEKVEVWRMTETGRREDLRVNSSGDMYYDPDDEDWHKIK